MIFSDESPFVLFSAQNGKNDIVWAKYPEQVPDSEVVKYKFQTLKIESSTRTIQLITIRLV